MVEPSDALQAVFDKAVSDAKKLKHEYVTLEHMLYAMLCEKGFETVLTDFEADVATMKSALEKYLKEKCDDIKTDQKVKPKKTQSVERCLNRAFAQTLFQGRNEIDIVDIFISLLSEKRSYAFFCTQQVGIDKDKFVRYANSDLDRGIGDADGADENMGAANKALRAFTADLNSEVKDGKIDPVIGRSEEIE